MKLSSKSKYGIRAMVALAIEEENLPLSISTISKKENISAYYLEQLIPYLKNANLIKSVRGPRGGYKLAKSADKITVGEIIKLMEGPIEIADCVDGVICINEGNCATRMLWKKLKISIENILDSITIQDILNDYKREINNLEGSDVYI